MKRSPHLISESPTYQSWLSMKARCLNPANSGFQYYGARGITVCERWQLSFKDFLQDMGERPSRQHTLDRINVDGNYEKDNCRWATTAEQADNKRNSKFIDYRGKRMTIGQAILEAGATSPRKSVTSRIRRGWPIDEAIELPPLRHRYERRT